MLDILRDKSVLKNSFDFYVLSTMKLITNERK